MNGRKHQQWKKKNMRAQKKKKIDHHATETNNDMLGRIVVFRGQLSWWCSWNVNVFMYACMCCVRPFPLNGLWKTWKIFYTTEMHFIAMASQKSTYKRASGRACEYDERFNKDWFIKMNAKAWVGRGSGSERKRNTRKLDVPIPWCVVVVFRLAFFPVCFRLKRIWHNVNIDLRRIVDLVHYSIL